MATIHVCVFLEVRVDDKHNRFPNKGNVLVFDDEIDCQIKIQSNIVDIYNLYSTKQACLLFGVSHLSKTLNASWYNRMVSFFSLITLILH